MMNVLRNTLKYLLLVSGIFSIIMLALILIVIGFRKNLHDWKLSVIILSVSFVVFIVVQASSIYPFFKDYSNLQVNTFEKATVTKMYVSNNLLSINEIELSFPDGKVVWIYTREYFEVGTKLKQISVAKESDLIIEYQLDYNN